MFHEVATLIHPIKSSKPAARVKGIRLIALLKVPRLPEGRPYLARVHSYEQLVAYGPPDDSFTFFETILRVVIIQAVSHCHFFPKK